MVFVLNLRSKSRPFKAVHLAENAITEFHFPVIHAEQHESWKSSRIVCTTKQSKKRPLQCNNRIKVQDLLSFNANRWKFSILKISVTFTFTITGCNSNCSLILTCFSHFRQPSYLQVTSKHASFMQKASAPPPRPLSDLYRSYYHFEGRSVCEQIVACRVISPVDC